MHRDCDNWKFGWSKRDLRPFLHTGDPGDLLT